MVHFLVYLSEVLNGTLFSYLKNKIKGNLNKVALTLFS